MDNPLTPEQQAILIEDALHTYPPAEMPRDLTVDVMSRIRAIPAPRPFRFSWSDLVLAVFIALCIGAVWFSLYNLPPLVVAQVRKESILFYQYLLVNARWLIPVVSFSVAAFLSALTIPYLRQEWTKGSS
jgi:hypothetical protein